jgi:hypothetical protein
MPDLEALGDAATGAVLGRAVEPQAGEQADGHTAERNCLNCGCALVGEYCHCCGQRAHVHRTLTAFFHDLLHGVLHFEGKIWRTLPLLAWRPGELTRRYIDGQRASFVSPIALFLFSVFLMFAVASATGALDFNANPAMRADLAQEIGQDQAKVGTLEAARRAAVAAARPTAAIDAKLTSARRELAAIRAIQQKGIAKGAAVQLSDDMPGWLRGSVGKAAANPELLVYKLKTNAYKFSWALIPLSVPFVWLLFPFSRRFRLYDHIVFVTYSLCFMTLLVVASVPVSAILGETTASLLFFVPPIHMYRQLKGAYGLGRFGAGWRTVALLLFTIFAAVLFFALLVALGLFD